METCPIYKQGKAFYEVDINDKKLFLCEIEEGTCKYKNEKGRFNHLDNNKEYSICKTNGLIRVAEIPTVFTD